MSDNWFRNHGAEFFRKFTDAELAASVEQWLEGTGNMGALTRHFFDDLVYRARNVRRRVRGEQFGLPKDASIWDAMHCDEFMDWVFKFIYEHPKTFWKEKASEAFLQTSQDAEFNNADLERLKCFFRIGQFTKVSVFPPNNVRQVVRKLFPDHSFFDEPLNYHDPSCGFGTRAAAGLLLNCRYYGTDPYKELNVRLKEMVSFLKGKWKYLPDADIRCQGSETFIPEWEGIMDLSFTSPPYFDWEWYSDDKCASTRNYGDYGKWLEEFLYPSIRNSIRYLKPGGYYCRNVKNTPNGKPLWDDALACVKSISDVETLEPMDFVPTTTRKFQVHKKDGSSVLSCASESSWEKIMVARKKASS